MPIAAEKIWLAICFIAFTAILICMFIGSDGIGSGFIVMITIAALLGLYFLPAIVAHARNHRQAPAIFILNLFLGWSVIGWVGALVWAATN